MVGRRKPDDPSNRSGDSRQDASALSRQPNGYFFADM